MFLILPFIYFLAFGITGLILWYKMHRIMERKGRRFNFFWVAPGPLIEFGKVIKEETDPKLKMKYRIILWVQLALIPLYMIGMFILIELTTLKKLKKWAD